MEDMWACYINMHTYLSALILIPFSGVLHNCLMWLLMFYLKPYKGNSLIVGSTFCLNFYKLHCISWCLGFPKYMFLRPVKKRVFYVIETGTILDWRLIKTSQYYEFQHLSQKVCRWLSDNIAFAFLYHTKSLQGEHGKKSHMSTKQERNRNSSRIYRWNTYEWEKNSECLTCCRSQKMWLEFCSNSYP